MKNADGKHILLRMVHAIQQNKGYLREIDGFIGGGDHATNMNMGFTMFGDRIRDKEVSFTGGLYDLGYLLFSKIGGGVGDVYGILFMSMAKAGRAFDEINLYTLAIMLNAGLNALQDIAQVRPGDKTLVDTLYPANKAIQRAAKEGKRLADALREMKTAARAGRDSTRNMAAKFGYSRRLSGRLRGILDPGAVSCCIILCVIADSILEMESPSMRSFTSPQYSPACPVRLSP